MGKNRGMKADSMLSMKVSFSDFWKLSVAFSKVYPDERFPGRSYGVKGNLMTLRLSLSDFWKLNVAFIDVYPNDVFPAKVFYGNGKPFKPVSATELISQDAILNICHHKHPTVAASNKGDFPEFHFDREQHEKGILGGKSEDVGCSVNPGFGDFGSPASFYYEHDWSSAMKNKDAGVSMHEAAERQRRKENEQGVSMHEAAERQRREREQAKDFVDSANSYKGFGFGCASGYGEEDSNEECDSIEDIQSESEMECEETSSDVSDSPLGELAESDAGDVFGTVDCDDTGFFDTCDSSQTEVSDDSSEIQVEVGKKNYVKLFYEFIWEKSVDGKNLYRVRSLRDFKVCLRNGTTVKKGELGGLVENPHSFVMYTEQDASWIAYDACVFGDSILRASCVVNSGKVVKSNLSGSIVSCSDVTTSRLVCTNVYGAEVIDSNLSGILVRQGVHLSDARVLNSYATNLYIGQ